MRTPAVIFLTACTLLACAEDPTEDPERGAPDGMFVITDDAARPDAQTADFDAGADSALTPDAEAMPDAAPDLAPDGPPPRGEAGPGEACATDNDCAEGVCLSEPGYPGGYCAITGCGPDAPCPNGTTCVDRDEGPICAAACTDQDCRAGYACVDANGAPVCLPGAPGAGRVDGLPCSRDDQCAGGDCIIDWPGGFCTTVNCADRTNCARGDQAETDNRCFVANRPPFCVRMCVAPTDCRAGYVCEPVGQGLGVCFPNPNEPLLDPEEIADSPLGIECIAPDARGGVAWPFDVAEGTTAYMVVPFSEDGADLQPLSIVRPDGATIDFRGRNSFQSAPSQVFGGQNPTVVPATRNHADQLASGRHSYLVNSGASRVCWYRL
ncbi:MAG: hypothetical protein KC620_21160, partial [Myxococcales bacterium]|nr:hypothetical protein [Myxococcales bacterium]